MPTVATSNCFDLHHLDMRGASRFFLDAEELCCNSASFLGLGSLVTSNLQSASMHPKQHGKFLAEGDGGESDCLLLGSHSDDDLSPDHSHHGNAAMQFLLLDDDEIMCTHNHMLNAPEPVPRKVEAPTACMPTTESVHPLIRQHSTQQDPCVPFDSCTMYCLAVVDEATGLPLRPATPEETWEVERCFVLQQQSELLDAGLPLEQQCCRMGSASVSEVKDEDSEALVPEQEQGMGGEPPEPEQEEEEEREEEQEEEEAAEEAAAPARTNNNTNKRPEQQQRRCGPCDNCGATESPQWRQGPASKPLLCNACGMRFRRTNQLIAGETGTASGARGGARTHKKSVSPAGSSAAAAPLGPRQKAKQAAPPPQLPEAKRPRRAAAVAAAATVAAAIESFS